jgi:hypothetical protein
MFVELLHLFLWDGLAPLVPNSKVHGVWTEQGGSTQSSFAVCMSSVKNCWPSEEHLWSPLPYTLIGSRASWHICTQIGQTVANCAALWSCAECKRMMHWQSASRCTKQLPGTTKYYDRGTVISDFTLEECELVCLCTSCNELLLFVHSSGGISEEIPVWNADRCYQFQTQQWASQEFHKHTRLQQRFLTSTS